MKKNEELYFVIDKDTDSIIKVFINFNVFDRYMRRYNRYEKYNIAFVDLDTLNKYRKLEKELLK